MKQKKLTTVIEGMGASYLCHPSNHVRRLVTPLKDSAGTDITKTFARIVAAMECHPDNVRRIVAAK